MFGETEKLVEGLIKNFDLLHGKVKQLEAEVALLKQTAHDHQTVGTANECKITVKK